MEFLLFFYINSEIIKIKIHISFIYIYKYNKLLLIKS